MKNYLLTPEAETNLLDIIDVISIDSPDAADRVLNEFTETFQLLSETPGIGHYREELPNNDFDLQTSTGIKSFTSGMKVQSRSSRSFMARVI